MAVGTVPGAAFDLGVHGTSYAFATEDEELIDVLRGQLGTDVAAALKTARPLLRAMSPPRVVVTGAARGVVATSMPAVDFCSARRSHSHLVPAAVAERRLLQEQLSLPGGCWVSAVVHLPLHTAGDGLGVSSGR